MAELLNEHTFVSSGKDPVPVEDVHGDQGLEEINKDTPAQSTPKESETDNALKVSGQEGQANNLDKLRKKLPNKVVDHKYFKKAKIDVLLDNVEQIEKAGDGILTRLSTEDLYTLSDEMNGLQKLVSGKDVNLTSRDIINGINNPVVQTGLVLLAVDKLIGKNLDIFAYLHDTKIAKWFKGHTMDRIMDIAAKYGAVDIIRELLGISDLIESQNEKYSDPERTNGRIRNILHSFYWNGDVYIEDLTEEDTYILSSIEQITTGYHESENNPNYRKKKKILSKEEQAQYLVDVLYKIEPKWIDTYIGVERAQNMDYFEYCSRHALEALMMDPRTRTSAVVYSFNRSAHPGHWYPKAKRLYPDLYAPAGYY